MTDKGLPAATRTESDGISTRLETMVGLFERAARHRRPMLLIAIYPSEPLRVALETDLRERLEARGYRVATVEVTGRDDADLVARIIAHPAAADPKTVFFCRGLGRGFPMTLYSLNIRRELLTTGHVKAVFWVTEEEAERMTRDAPDFWAFRGRVIEFLDLPSSPDLPQSERERGVSLRERLLRQLPEDDTTLAERAQLHRELAGLYYAERNTALAERHLRRAHALEQQMR